MQASAARKIGHFPEPRTPCHHFALHGYMPAPRPRIGVKLKPD